MFATRHSAIHQERSGCVNGRRYHTRMCVHSLIVSNDTGSERMTAMAVTSEDEPVTACNRWRGSSLAKARLRSLSITSEGEPNARMFLDGRSAIARTGSRVCTLHRGWTVDRSRSR